MKEEFFMSVRKPTNPKIALLLGLFFFSVLAAFASDGVILYTPYTKIAISPGQSIDYSIDVINKSDQLFDGEIQVSNIPRSWTYSLKSGAYTISKIAVLPEEKKSISLKVEVPYQVNKGNYNFRITAGDSATLPLIITITEKGSSETEFSTDQSNMQGNAKATFSYKTSLINRTPEKQLYALMADAPRGWEVTFKADYKAVTSVEMEPNTTKEINIDIKPTDQVKAGTYKIPVRAVTSSTSANLELEAVVTGSYAMELTTPTGLVSTSITAGSSKKLQLVVRNTGSSDLTAVEMKSGTPSKWEVIFDPVKIDRLSPGSEATVYATIQSDKKAIPGDYVATLEAKNPETSSKISFRVMVKTRMIWGWIGVLVILAALGGVIFLFKKFGRR
ncbi:MAG: NEW3 domain-containing protein [Mangrovibacterium sp.]|nr:NEW3 domain-containing protein [Mangrovibacterium sp.]